MITWLYLIVMLVVTVSHERNATVPTILEMGSGIREALEQLCPNVDICNLNASDSTVRPNGELIFRGWKIMSCCKGCSCHHSCHDNLNCCFPEKVASAIGETSTTECLHVKTGPIDEKEKQVIPAYHLVSSAPKEGCKKQRSVINADGSRRLKGSCGPEAVAPWGNLFPVYSVERNMIYKNDLCASCHGVDDTIPWQSYLVCQDNVNGRKIPLSEHLLSLENGFENFRCSVMFYYSDIAALADKRCYKDVVSTCPLYPAAETVSAPNISNLTTEELFDACHSGLNSPVNIQRVVYRNIFCAICNEALVIQPLTCKPVNSDPRGVSVGITLLLNPMTLDKINGRGVAESPRSLPHACLHSDFDKTTKTCRNILCPSGQIRSPDGNCIFPVSRYYPGNFMVILKLSYFNSRNILDMLHDGILGKSTVVESFRKLNPWPPRWYLMSIFHSTDVEDSQLVIMMTTETNNLITLYKDIIGAIAKPWTATFDGQSFLFKQTLLEYKDFTVLSYKENTNIPKWKSIAISLNLQTDVMNTTTNTWNLIFSLPASMSKPMVLTKLFLCQQISLHEDEYSLLVEDRVLISNMTKRILFEAEFDLVDNGTGTEKARVCLSDSLFQINRKKSVSAGQGQHADLYLFFSFITAWCIIGTE